MQLSVSMWLHYFYKLIGVRVCISLIFDSPEPAWCQAQAVLNKHVLSNWIQTNIPTFYKKGNVSSMAFMLCSMCNSFYIANIRTEYFFIIELLLFNIALNKKRDYMHLEMILNLSWDLLHLQFISNLGVAKSFGNILF